MIPFNIGLTTYFSKAVDYNPAVIVSFNSMTAFTTAITFYVIFKEKLTLQHGMGMILIVMSLMIVAISKSMEQDPISGGSEYSFL